MPKEAITTFIESDTALLEEDADKETVIDVHDVSVVFNMASEKLNSLKEYFIAVARRELMFKEFKALQHVSFEVKRGDVFGILGTNGSGKSTMLKVVAGVLEPSTGYVDVRGRIAPLIELGAGFDPELTARENVFLNGALLGYPRKFIEEKYDEIIDFAEIEDFQDMPIKNYSSGMVARIAFAIATVIVPEILIVDEVLSVGDAMFQLKCERRIKELIEEHNVTVLIVSHNTEQVERLCNKAIWIEKSHTRMIGAAQDICAAYRLVGGKIGSEEAESKIVEAMRQEADEDDIEDEIGEIAGTDRYDTAVAIAEEYADGQKLVHVAYSDRADMAAIASCCAGALDAVLYNTAVDHIPDGTIRSIKHLAPERVTLFGTRVQIGGEVEQAIVDAGFEHVDRVGVEDGGLMSVKAYERALERGGSWGDACVVARAADKASYVPLSGIMFSDKMPIFFIGGEPSSDEAVARVVEGAFPKVILSVLERDGADDAPIEAFEQRMAKAGVGVRKISADTPTGLSCKLNTWIEEQRAGLGLPARRELMFCIVDDPVDAFLIGPYAAKCDLALLNCNTDDMDSTAAAIGFIQSHEPFDKLYFLGGLTRFSKADRALFAKVALGSKG